MASTMSSKMSIPEYFSGTTVFVTGATGFMGKVLIEKLLRSCPDIRKIYMLMRPKRGHGTRERLQEMINSMLFDRLRKEAPKSFDKLQVVAGDILDEGLGLSAQDRELLQNEVQVVFHSAACVRFDLPIRDAVNQNTVGTSRVLELASGMKKLECFLHISTAYCESDLEVLEEKVYPSKHRPQDVMECCRWMDNDLLNHLQPKLLNPQPNTYAYTKSLSEDLVAQYEGKFPIAIARPSIVTASLKEPVPGWIDNINGPTGLILAASKGVLRSMIVGKDVEADGIPVDIAVNGCIALAYTCGIDRPKKLRVCNITQSGVNPITWERCLELGRMHYENYPFSQVLWYPDGGFTSSWVQHQMTTIFTQWLPAYFFDLLLYLLGHKPFLVHVQKKISYGLDVLQYYTMKSWRFKNDAFLALKDRLTQRDNKVFFTDLNEIDWNDFLRNYIRGIRDYLVKEDPATVPQAKILLNRLYWADRIIKVLFYCFVGYLLYNCTMYFVSRINSY